MSRWPPTVRGDLLEMSENVTGILAIELLAAAQGCDFHTGLRSSQVLENVRALLRAQVPMMTGDRYFKPDLEAAIALIRHRDVIGCVAPDIFPGLAA